MHDPCHVYRTLRIFRSAAIPLVMEDEVTRDPELHRRIVDMRDGGATWLQIQHQFSLTRQQARYGYQLGKRVQRRAQRREEGSSS